MELKYRLGLLGILCLLVVAMFFLKETSTESSGLHNMIDQSETSLTVLPASFIE
jgi:hypothetical protein